MQSTSLNSQVLLVVAAVAAFVMVFCPTPSQAVLSGTGGVFKSPAAQEYFARRFGGALDAARSAGRLAGGRALEATNEIEDVIPAPEPKLYVPNFFRSAPVEVASPAPSPYLMVFRNPIYRQ